MRGPVHLPGLIILFPLRIGSFPKQYTHTRKDYVQTFEEKDIRAGVYTVKFTLTLPSLYCKY